MQAQSNLGAVGQMVISLKIANCSSVKLSWDSNARPHGNDRTERQLLFLPGWSKLDVFVP